MDIQRRPAPRPSQIAQSARHGQVKANQQNTPQTKSNTNPQVYFKFK